MAQKWPDQDVFTGGGTAFSYPNRYLRFRPSVNPVTYTGSTQLISRPGDLIKHRKFVNQTPVERGVFAIDKLAPASTAPFVHCDFLERDTQFADGEVSARFFLDRYVGQSSGFPSTMKAAFVYGRVTGGALTSGGVGADFRDEFIANPTTCVFAGYISSITSNVGHFVMGEFAAGVVTIRAVEQAAQVYPFGATDRQHISIQQMRLVLNGGTWKLFVSAYPDKPLNAPIPPASGLEVISVTSMATGPSGRWGFGMQPFETDPLAPWTGGFNMDWIQLVNSSGTLLFRDEFKRVLPSTSQRWSSYASDGAEIADPLGEDPQALSMMSAYTGDGAGRDWDAGVSNTFVPYTGLLHCSAAVPDKISIGRDLSLVGGLPGATEQNYGFYYDQNVDTAQVNHHRSLVFEFNASTGARAGIMLRGQLGSVGGQAGPEMRFRYTQGVPDVGSGAIGPGICAWGKVGYCCWIKYDSSASPQWELGVWRFNPPVAIQIYPEIVATADLTSLGLLSGVPITLDFEVQNFAQDGSQDGIISMRVKINGAVVALVPSIAIPGLAYNNEWLTDLSAPATLYTGYREAMFAENYAGAVANHVEITSFHKLALSDPPAPPVESQASVVLVDENDGLFGVLATPIDWSIKTDYTRASRELRTEAGYRIASPRGSRTRRSWKLRGSGVTDAQRDTLIEFWKSHDGPTIPFNWTRDDTGVTTTVRFVGGSLAHGRMAVNAHNYSFSLEETFSHTDYNKELA